MERLTPDELTYHNRVMSELRAAQAAWDSWSKHLVAKYELTQGDGINEKGEVVRAKPDPE